MTGRYISCADTAKILRGALKTAFPGVKFSVRSQTYSGGASIDVYWQGGPTAKQVEAVTHVFQGGGFDGMIDLKYDVSAWLLPDRSVVLAHSSGTEASRGSVPGFETPKPHPDAELVDFASDYVFCHRQPSAEEQRDYDVYSQAKREIGEFPLPFIAWQEFNAIAGERRLSGPYGTATIRLTGDPVLDEAVLSVANDMTSGKMGAALRQLEPDGDEGEAQDA